MMCLLKVDMIKLLLPLLLLIVVAQQGSLTNDYHTSGFRIGVNFRTCCLCIHK